jgi:hypothetical protein
VFIKPDVSKVQKKSEKKEKAAIVIVKRFHIMIIKSGCIFMQIGD